MSVSPSSALRQSLRRRGLALQQAVRQVRSFVIPSHVLTYREIVRERALRSEDMGHSFVYFDFRSIDIDNVGGRYLYGLVRDFEAIGLVPCFARRFRFLATMRHKTHKRRLLDRPFRVAGSLTQLPPGSVRAVVTDYIPAGVPADAKLIRINYEERWPAAVNELPMTFFVFPPLHDAWLAAPAPDLDSTRPWRIFFAGRGSAQQYSKDILPRKFGKLSRYQMLQALQETLPAERVRRLRTTEEGDNIGGDTPAFVWPDPDRHVIPRDQWLASLDRADFFLACPGLDMPLCHNLIESMSRGAIPILEHPEFLDPTLESGVNCIAFHGRDGLLRSVDRALSMSADEVAALRAGVYEYYRAHLAPGAFAARLIGHPHQQTDLLINAYRTRRAGY